MNAKMLTLLAIAGATALAGCAAPEEAGDSGGSAPTDTTTTPGDTGAGGSGGGGGGQQEPAAPFRVVSAERRDGGCLFEGAQGSCHTVRVAIDNSGSTRDFSTNMFYWSAMTEDGQVFETPETEGADAIAGGRTGELTLEFDVDDPDAKLATLRYEQMFGDTLTAPIPDY